MNNSFGIIRNLFLIGNDGLVIIRNFYVIDYINYIVNFYVISNINYIMKFDIVLEFIYFCI